MSPPLMFGALMVGHVVCDYPLQGDFLARAKNRTAPIPGFPWWQALGAHALIHGGAVWLLTGVAMALAMIVDGQGWREALTVAATVGFWLGALEFIAHAVTDDAKCRGRLSLNQDQAIHAACKVAWALTAWRLSHV